MKKRTFIQKTGFIFVASSLVAVCGFLALQNTHISSIAQPCSPAFAATIDLYDSNDGMPSELKYKADPKLTGLSMKDLLKIRTPFIGPPPPPEVQNAQMEFIERQNKAAADLLKAGNAEEAADIEWISVFEVLDQSGSGSSLPRARALLLHSRYLEARGKSEEAKVTLKKATAILSEQGIKGTELSMLQVAQNSGDPASAEKSLLAGLQETYSARQDKYHEAKEAANIQCPFYFDDFFDPDSAKLVRKYAEVLKSTGRAEEAAIVEKRAVLFETKPVKLTDKQLSDLRKCFEEDSEAIDPSKEIQRILDFGKSFGETSPQYMTVLGWLGLHHRGVDGQPSFYTQLYEMQKKVLGADHLATTQSLSQVYQELREANDFPKATALAKEALVVAENCDDSSENGRDRLMSALDRLVEITELNKDWNNLLVYGDRLIKLKELEQQGWSEGDILKIKEKMSAAYLGQNNFAKAEEFYRQVLDNERKDKQSGGGFTGDHFSYIFKLAEIETKAKKFNEADMLYKEAIELAKKNEMTGSLPECMSKYAAFLKEAGRNEEALAIEKQASETKVKNYPSPY